MRILVLPINMAGYDSARTGLLRKLDAFQIKNESYINRLLVFYMKLTLHSTSNKRMFWAFYRLKTFVCIKFCISVETINFDNGKQLFFSLKM